jgi:hypothetical protein
MGGIMRHTNEVYFPIPRTRNTHCKVEINGQDMTARIIESVWVKPCTTGIGTFRVIVSNAHGQYTNTYLKGQTVKFYADNNDASTLQFWGRIDYIKDEISDNGQFLEIEGRHRGFLLNEFMICYSATNTGTSTIFTNIINKLPSAYGFTHTNLTSETTTMDVEWSYKAFWDCVVEICNRSGYDAYVDDNLDFHYFAENSILNTDDAIVEGDNFIESTDFGTNDYYEKTRVIAIGQDNEGLPIVYTAISPTEGDEIREFFVKETSANTLQKVKDIAEAKLAEVTNKNPQATLVSYGLETVKPGDNIWVIIPRQQIAGMYKIIQITHKFGQKSGGWRTETIIEEEEVGISKKIQKIAQTTQSITEAENVNKLNYSFNFNFDEDSGTHSSTDITGGVLKTTGGASGTWISQVKALTENATQFEMRVVGETIPGTLFYVSTDNGNTWQSISNFNTLYTFSPPGQNLKIKVVFNSASTQVKSLALLYS